VKRIIILPYAEVDINDSVSFYKEQEEGLDKTFIKIISYSFKEILKNPEAYPLVKFEIRKFVVKEFPYCIFYINKVEAVYILAIFHDKRNPKSWKKRGIKSR
jgi:toxin ParE1/3/4